MAGVGGKIGNFFSGTISSIFPDRGFGFISSAEAARLHGGDVWVSADNVKGLNSGDAVIFEVQIGKFGKPQAHNVGPFPTDPKRQEQIRLAAAAPLSAAQVAAAENAAAAAAGTGGTPAPVCCFFLQKKCRTESCPDKHYDEDCRPCSNQPRGCKIHGKRNEGFKAAGALGARYDPVAAAVRITGEAAPMKAIKPLSLDMRPSIPPPGQGHMASVPKYLQKRRDIDFSAEIGKWTGVVSELPRDGDSKGWIDSEDAKKEYRKAVWCNADQLLAFDVGDDVEFELVLDDKGHPQGRNVTAPVRKKWEVKRDPALVPVQNRNFQAGKGMGGASLRVGIGALRCDVCNMDCASAEQLQQHLQGKKHQMAEKAKLGSLNLPAGGNTPAGRVCPVAASQIMQMRSRIAAPQGRPAGGGVPGVRPPMGTSPYPPR
eukprot:TRINITY_DN64903_c0_g1_i1.p1 TRINITY_DN64903_c0_g1~~TRINITY_DN64903_c0_g1_i1.p1  ORF type:complete len:429 (+),score=99.00 TRINITY_DN64903_c0_g1_i1:102-1388(+)